jgi:hypothetical protein
LANQRFKRSCPLAFLLQLDKRLILFKGIDELHPTVLTNSDAGLWSIDFAAADTLPCLHMLNHVIHPFKAQFIEISAFSDAKRRPKAPPE